MINRTLIRNEHARSLYYTLLAFLKGRLEERDTIWWALNLTPDDVIKKLALLDTLNENNSCQLKSPWNLAWRLIEEYWNYPPYDEDSSVGEFKLKTRLIQGERSGSLVNAITDFIAPRLKIEKFTDITFKYNPPPKRVTKIEDLFTSSLASGKLNEPNEFGIKTLTDISFLLSLTQSLDAAVINGLDIARRLGWDSKYLWKLGGLHRVYYVPEESLHNEHEPDEFNDGIAPSVKLLHMVITRLVELDFNMGSLIVQRWKYLKTPVHQRLWAAMARDQNLAAGIDVANFLLTINNDYFWDKTNFPEIAELRANRFNSIPNEIKARLIHRLKKGPPRSFWSKQLNSDQVKEYSQHAAVSEFHRIIVAGGNLPEEIQIWLAEMYMKFPDIEALLTVDDDFYKTPKAHSIEITPDNRFDHMSGKERLSSLETALSTGKNSWTDNTSSSAEAWISKKLNSLQILEDFKSLGESGNSYANVWERFGSTHSPSSNENEKVVSQSLQKEASEVLELLIELKPEVIRKAINGISQWISSWSLFIKDSPHADKIWVKIWPIAVQATNALQSNDEEPDLNIVAKSSMADPMDLDTFNTPAGKLTDLFFKQCPRLDLPEKYNLKEGTKLREVADQITTAPGRSGLIVKHRMIEHIYYFISLDAQWTRENLIAPLKEDSINSIPLWRAIARRIQFSDVLKYIGNEFLQRVNDDRLARSSRKSLLFSLILESLNSLYEQRTQIIAIDRMQQMIRNLDDEIRAHGLQTLIAFVRQNNQLSTDTPEKRFRRAVVPFLKDVWPQERSLATPASSKVLARLPEASGSAFVDALSAIERFLVPFSSWSMLDYGLYGESSGKPKITLINTLAKAKALLRLLDLTIGNSDAAIIPHDLAKVLDHLKSISPKITKDYTFRRLATAARRI